MKNRIFFYLFIVLIGLSACKSYTANVILKTEAGDENWKDAYTQLMIDHPIRIGDRIQFAIFTNQGESVIDPTGVLETTSSQSSTNQGTSGQSAGAPAYDVLESGECIFPLIGKLKVAGLKITQLDSVLSIKYNVYYNDVYTISKVVNKRIIVLGGKGGQVIPFTPNMSLLEALALCDGLNNTSKGYNIRIIRGDLTNPQVKVVNLRTVKDMKQSIVSLMPNDIIYIEPVRRAASEGFKENIYLFTVMQAITTMVLLFNNLK